MIWQWLPIFLCVYFIIYMVVIFAWPTLRTWKQTGKNPIVLPKGDSPAALVGSYFKICIALLFVYVILKAVIPERVERFIPLWAGMMHVSVICIGLGLLVISAIWTILAQSHLGPSLRIGIDESEKTVFVQKGVFRFSRNPIFLGILVSLTGLFLITPDIVSLGLFLFAFVLIQLQIRFEETYLSEKHGSAYTDYKNRVRRLL